MDCCLEFGPFVKAAHEIVDLIRDRPVVHIRFFLPVEDGADLVDELFDELAGVVTLCDKLGSIGVFDLESLIPALLGLFIKPV